MTTAPPRRRSAGSDPALRAALPFLAVTFGISWGLWAVALRLGGDVADPVVMACYLLGACGPSLSALVMRLCGRSTGRRVRWASAPAWLPAALLLGAAPAVLGALAAPQLGGPAFDPSILTTAAAAAGGVLPYLAVNLVAGPLAEEFGWRGHLQPVLRRRFGPAATSALVGVVWAVWHVPLFLLVGTSQAQIGLLTPAAVVFFAAMLPTSVVSWFVSERLRGGVPGAVLVHLAVNISLTLLFVAPSAGGVACALVALVLIAAVLLGRARPAADVGDRI
jgi:membrane protease YdiL (CAAX protease family)